MIEYANSGASSTSSSMTTKDVAKITDKLFKVSRVFLIIILCNILVKALNLI